VSVEGSLADGDNGSVGGDLCWWRDENCDQTFPSFLGHLPLRHLPPPRKLSSRAPAPLVNVRVQT